MPTVDRARIRLELSGCPRLVDSLGRARPLEPHDAALLALLALEGPVARDRLYALIWPDRSRKTAQGNLRQRLFRLRRKTGLDLVLAAETLILAPNVEHDLAQEANKSDALLGDLRFDASEELAAWVDAVRERRHREASEQLAAEASRLETAGRLAEAIDLAERLVQREPALEHAHRRLMRLHYRRGDRAAALRVFQRCRISLDRAVGTTPSAETEALAAVIEHSGELPEPSPAPPPIALLRPPRLVGREDAWRAWEDGWRDHRIVVIDGEPGIGKSRLLEDFAGAVGGADIARAHPGDARMPYTSWARWLRGWRLQYGAVEPPWIERELARLVPGLGVDPPAGEMLPTYFRQASFDALAAWCDRGLGTVMIDDLHHVDAATLELLLGWLMQSPKQRIALAVRSREMPAALVDWLDVGRLHPRVAEVTLRPLDVKEVGELIASLELPGLDGETESEALSRATAGNPLFVIELLRTRRSSGASATPPVLARLISQRLEQLSPDALRLARLAGLAGLDFSAEVACAALGVRPLDLADAWAELEQAQIFLAGQFVHELMLEGAAASVPESLAKPLHGAIAIALEPLGVAPARVAHHALAAGAWASAARHLETAATATEQQGRHREALQFWDEALRCHEQIGDRAAAHRVGCRSIDAASHVEGDADLESRTAGLLRDAIGDPAALDALIARLKHLGVGFRHAEMIDAGEHGLMLARQLGNRTSELIIAGMLAIARSYLGHVDEALALTTAYASKFEDLPANVERYELAAAHAVVLLQAGRAAESAKWGELAVEEATRLGRDDTIAIGWGNLAVAKNHAGRSQEALQAARLSLVLHARGSDDSSGPVLVARLTLAGCLIRSGFMAEAELLLEQLMVAARSQAPGILSIAENYLATLYVQIGQTARADRLLELPITTVGRELRRTVIKAKLAITAKRHAEWAEAASLDPRIVVLPPIDRLTLRMAFATSLPAEAALRLATSVRTESRHLGLDAVALAAAARLASASYEMGAVDDALAWARAAQSESATITPFDMDIAEFGWHLCAGHLLAAPEGAASIARDTIERLRMTLARIPQPYRETYWYRSHFTSRLRAVAAQGGPPKAI